MKNLIKSVVIASSVFIASSLVFALPVLADQKSDNALLTECKDSINETVEGVTNVKVSKIKSRRGLFTAKFRVSANGERFVMECTSQDGSAIALVQ